MERHKQPRVRGAKCGAVPSETETHRVADPAPERRKALRLRAGRRNDPTEVRTIHDCLGESGPTLCPGCGKDLNTYIVIQYVDLITKRRAEGGWAGHDGVR